MECLFCLIFFILSAFCDANGVLESRLFNVKPGGQTGTTEIIWEEVKFTFTYQAQGGTNEEWMIGIFRPHDKIGEQISCIVQRPEGTVSYLYFQSFSLKVEGAKYEMAQVFGPRYDALPVHEFKELPKKHIVQDGSKFSNAMGKVVLYASLASKDEL